MKKRKKTKIIWMCMLIILVLIAVMSLVLFYTIDSDATHEYVVNLNLLDDSVETDSKISIEIKEVEHHIIDEGMETERMSIRYSGTINNNLVSDIFEWKLIAKLPVNVLIEDSWGGVFAVNDKNLVITPNDNTNKIAVDGHKNFEFVMVSDKRVKFSEVQFSCMRQAALQQYELFWGVISAIAVWILAAIIIIISGIRTRHFNEIRENDAKIISQTMQMFAGFIDAKDAYTKGHSVRVAYYSREIGRRMKMSEDDVVKLGYIALMHDCGKIGVPDDVLTKPQGLAQDERIKIKEHTIMGGKILEGFTAIKGIRDGALYHHECYDGSGYPEGLKGKEIPLCARIIGVADAYDAMSTNRCYRNRLTQTDIVQELEAGRGTQFDPDIVTHMINMIDEGCCQIDDNIEL